MGGEVGGGGEGGGGGGERREGGREVGTIFGIFGSFGADFKSKLLNFEFFGENWSVFRRLGSSPGYFKNKNLLLIVLRVK